MKSFGRQNSMNRRVYDTFLPAKNEEYLDVNQLNSLLKDLWKEEDHLEDRSLGLGSSHISEQDRNGIWPRSEPEIGTHNSSHHRTISSKPPSSPTPMKTLNPWGYEENPEVKSASIWADRPRPQNMGLQKKCNLPICGASAAMPPRNVMSNKMAPSNSNFIPISQDVRKNNSADNSRPKNGAQQAMTASSFAMTNTKADLIWNNSTLNLPTGGLVPQTLATSATNLRSSPLLTSYSAVVPSHSPSSPPITIEEKQPRSFFAMTDTMANFLMMHQLSSGSESFQLGCGASLANSGFEPMHSIVSSDSGCDSSTQAPSMTSSSISQTLPISPSSVNLNSFLSLDNIGWNSDDGSSSGYSRGHSDMSDRNLASPTDPIECAVSAEIPGSVQNYKKFKTKMCLTVSNGRDCMYGERCQFSHNLEELRPTRYPLNYKKIKCRQFHTTGRCQFAGRCTYVHDLNPLETQMIKEFKELKGFNEFLKSL